MFISSTFNKNVSAGSALSRAAAAVVLGTAVFSTSAFAAKDDTPKGKPFQAIDEQLSELDQRLTNLSSIVDEQLMLTMPVEVNVNCAAGDSVAAALAEYANATAPLTINIEGVCNEVVGILRSNVTLNGASTDATIHSDHGVFGSVTVSRSVGNVNLTNLTLSGGTGLLATRSSNTFLSNVEITQTNNGLLAVDNASVTLEDSHIFDNNVGVLATRQGNAGVVNSTVENNTVGLLAQTGGLVYLQSTSSSGNNGAGSVVSNNTLGAMADSGGRLVVANSRIEGNSAIGVRVRTQSSVRVGGGSLISGNQIGVQAHENTSVELSGATAEISGNTIGVRCMAPTAYLTPAPPGAPGPIVINNSVDLIDCRLGFPTPTP